MSGLGPCVGCPQSQCRAPATLSVTFSGLSDIVQVAENNWFAVRGWSSTPTLVRRPAVPLRIIGTGPGVPLGTPPELVADIAGPVGGIRIMPFSTATGSIPDSSAGTGFATLGRTEPTIRAYINNTGSGATFSGTLASTTNLDGLPGWRVASVSVAASEDAGGYANNSLISPLTADGSLCETETTLRLTVGRGQPTLRATVATALPCSCSTPGATDGYGASFSITYQQTSSAVGSETWAVSQVSVLNGGRGYTNGLQLVFSAGNADVLATHPVASIVTSNGVITEVVLASGGVCYKAGVPRSVTVVSGGFFFKEDPSLPPLVATPTVTYPTSNPASPSDRATFDVTIDDDVESETFGHITNVEILSAGDNYIAWREAETCLSELNGRTIVLRNESAPASQESVGEPAVILCASSSFGFPPVLSITVPEDYDSLETGIDAVNIINNGGKLAYLEHAQPEVKISGGGGSGATFDVQWRERQFSGIPYWEIASVAAKGGSGYVDNAFLTVSLATSADKLASSSHASLQVRQQRIEPEVAIATPCHAGGATFYASWRDNGDTPRTFGLQGVEVINGGSGYPENVPLQFSVKTGSTQSQAACAVGLARGGSIVSVDVRTAGKYFRQTTEAGSVQVNVPFDGNFALYYRELSTVRVADVGIEAVALPPNTGASGAAISLTVNTTAGSATFGQVTSASVTSPGTGYILRRNRSSSPGQVYTDTCGLEPPYPLPPFPWLPIRCQLWFDENSCLPALRLTQGTSSVEFAADKASIQLLSNDQRSVTLTPVLPGNTGQAVVEWGGDFDFDNRICSCCDISLERCNDPPVSGWPAENVNAFRDPLELVFPVSCVGTDANGNFLAPNGGVLLWTAVYDGNGNFVSWQLMCGECEEAIFIDFDQNGDPIYSATPEPITVITERGTKGRTACSCFPFDTEQGCLWEPEIGEDGCWTGGYVLADISCENPLP